MTIEELYKVSPGRGDRPSMYRWPDKRYELNGLIISTVWIDREKSQIADKTVYGVGGGRVGDEMHQRNRMFVYGNTEVTLEETPEASRH